MDFVNKNGRLAERSKARHSSCRLSGGAGSNPTAFKFLFCSWWRRKMMVWWRRKMMVTIKSFGVVCGFCFPQCASLQPPYLNNASRYLILALLAFLIRKGGKEKDIDYFKNKPKKANRNLRKANPIFPYSFLERNVFHSGLSKCQI